MLARQKKTKDDLESANKAHKALKDKIKNEKLQAQQTEEEIERRSKTIESNQQEMDTITKEGKQRRRMMKGVSAGFGILSTLGTVAAVSATVLFPPAGVVAAGNN